MAKMREEGVIEDLGWDNEGDDDQYEELCNCRFSLAYGGKILLNNAALRLVGGVAPLCLVSRFLYVSQHLVSVCGVAGIWSAGSCSTMRPCAWWVSLGQQLSVGGAS